MGISMFLLFDGLINGTTGTPKKPWLIVVKMGEYWFTMVNDGNIYMIYSDWWWLLMINGDYDYIVFSFDGLTLGEWWEYL